MQDYYDTLFPVVLETCNDPYVAARSNSAFCLRVMVEHGSPSVKEAFPAVLTALTKLFDVSAAGPRDLASFVYARDNAVSAVLKMVVKAPEVLPLDRVLPLVLSGCPLEEDQQEQQFVYSSLMQLAMSHTQAMRPYLPALAAVFTKVCQDEKVDAELRQSISNFMQQVQQAGLV
jgi:hypothetical protein